MSNLNDNDRAYLEVLKLENKQLKEENFALKEKLANSAACNFPSVSDETVKLNQEVIQSRTINIISGKQISGTQFSANTAGSPNYVPKGVSSHLVITPKASVTITDLSCNMVTTFFENLSKHWTSDIVPLAYMGHGDVRVSVRLNDEPSSPMRFLLSASASVSLDLSVPTLFYYFDEEKTRFQWDPYSDDSAEKLAADISFGTYPGNRVSIYEPSSRKKSSMVILQERYGDPLEPFIVCAPIETECIRSAISGAGQSSIPFLPMGFLISGDNGESVDRDLTTSSRTSSCLCLTMFFQMYTGSATDQNVSKEAVDIIEGIVSTTLQKIKCALSG